MSALAKLRTLPGRGTLLNFATVLVGASLGLALRGFLYPEWMASVRLSLGIVTICFGLRMFLSSRNPVVVALALAIGGIIGTALGIDVAVEEAATWVKTQLGGDENFVSGLVVTSVLFCVGPMTLLGCIRDAMDRNIDLLKMKSTMDGIVAVFFAAAYGSGVLVTAFVVLVFQGLLTLLAAPMRKLAEDKEFVDEITGTGGPVLVIVGLSLAEIVKVSSANYLPALLIVPVILWVFRHVSRLTSRPTPAEPSV